MLTVTSASRIWFIRTLPARNMKLGWPLRSVITALRLNSTRAVGREMRAKISPVPTAVSARLEKASTVTSVWA